MEVIFGLVGVTVILVILIAMVLLWAVRSGQFDDLEGPAWRVLMDDDAPKKPEDSHADKTKDPERAGTRGAPPCERAD